MHTPRDINWTGSSCTSDDQRRAYGTRLVEACRQQGLRGIAITDHHDMAFAPFVRRAAEAETDESGSPIPKEQQLVVFPGMELTLAVPCQALLIFDADFPDDLFSLAMTALAIVPNPIASERTAQVGRLNIQSLRELKEVLDKHTFLRDRYIVLPHVGDSGQFSLLRKGLATKYIEMPCVGGYLDGEIGTKMGQGNQTIVAGKAKEWGNKRIACFQTSDNRFEDHRELGRASTWIKWTVPTAEGLRQACLAQESRVLQEAPSLPSAWVGKISVSNSVFLGPIDLELNPQYTALIGGRGTGKSTILEYLRWALCDQPPTSGDEDAPNYQARRIRLIDQTLKPVKATVQVAFELNGVAHAIRRDSADGALLIKIANDEMRPCTEDEVRTLLPIQAYSQKQLSEVSVRIDELSRFITAPIRTELSQIDRKTDEQGQRVRQAYTASRRQRTLVQALQSRELEEKSLTGQADVLRAGLTGLSDDDRALLDKGRSYDLADRAVQSWRDGVNSLGAGVKDLGATVGALLEQPDVPSEPEAAILQSAHDQYRKLLLDAKDILQGLKDRADALAAETVPTVGENPWHQWAERLRRFKESYEAAVQRSSAHAEKMRQLRDIEDQLGKHVRETARLSEELRGIGSAETTFGAERDAWEALLGERNDQLEAECKRLTESSGGAIRAHVKRYADATDFVNVLRQYLSGSRLPAAKIERLAETITAGGDGAAAQWKAVLRDLGELAQIDPSSEGERKTDAPTLRSAGFSATDLDRVVRSLKPEDWLALSLTPISSIPEFEYRANESDYMPFSNASAGQQATALLKTLLNQAGPPLIIDQPEEDLDNPVMLEIVAQVWQAKQRRQLVFASHNANLVVNGDAELVAWCEHRTSGDQSRGTIAGEGAIDVPRVRDAIKAIMEGGEAAFNMRREKYGF